MKLAELRGEIDAINQELIVSLGRRTEIARQIARIKKKLGLPILDTSRESEIKDEARRLARAYRISPAIVEEMFDLLLEYTRIEMEAAR